MLAPPPDVRQAADYDCGRAVLESAFKHWGQVLPPEWAALADPEDGLHPHTLVAVLRAGGFRVRHGSFRLADLKHFTDSGCPCLVVVTPPGLGGHWCTVWRVSSGAVSLLCPSRGPLVLPDAEFVEQWDDRDGEGAPYWRWAACPWR